MVGQTDTWRVVGAPWPRGRSSPARIWGAHFYRLSYYLVPLQRTTGLYFIALYPGNDRSRHCHSEPTSSAVLFYYWNSIVLVLRTFVSDANSSCNLMMMGDQHLVRDLVAALPDAIVRSKCADACVHAYFSRRCALIAG